MSDELREKVAMVNCAGDQWDKPCKVPCVDCLREADAAIALVLEEAAKVADDLSDRWTKEWRAGLKGDSRLEALSDGADDVAFAIRALKTQTTT